MDTSGSGTREHIVPQGSTVAGRYKLLRVLGEGGMGTVWLALDTSLDSNCAIKLIYGDNAQSAEMRRRFEREAKASAQLRGNNVVDVFDYGVWNDIPFIAMEFLEGEDLAQRLERVGRLTPAETYRVVVHVCRALSRAHARGIVHRDLKPENIFLTDMDGEEVAKVLDFGIAKNEKYSVRDNTTQLGAFLGTPHYVSPEQARGEPTDGRSDLWALAVIAFQAVTGRLPFYSESLGSLMGQILYDPIPAPSKVADGIPRGFDIWWKRAAQRNPSERFQSAQEFGDELAAALGVGHRLTIPSLPPRGSVSPPPAEEDSDRKSEIVITNAGGQQSADLPPIPLVPPVPLVPQRPGASHASADGSGSNPVMKQTMLGLGAADGAAAADSTGSHGALQRTRLGIGLGADSEAPTGKIGDAAAVAVSAASSSPGQADASGSNPAIDPALLASAAVLRNGAPGPGALKQAAVPKDLLPAPPTPPPPRAAPAYSSGAPGAVASAAAAGSDDSLDVEFPRSGLLGSVKALPRGQKVAVGSVGVLLVFVVVMALFSSTSESADVESGQQAVAAPLIGNGADKSGSNDHRVESAKPESTTADLNVSPAEQGREGSDSTKEGKPDNRGLGDLVGEELGRDKSSQPAKPSLSKPAPKPPARQRTPRRKSRPSKSSTPTPDEPDYGI